MPIYAGFAYDAVLLYARALTQHMAKGGLKTNGTGVVDEMKGMRYQSKYTVSTCPLVLYATCASRYGNHEPSGILGYTVVMDEQSDAEGNYTLLASQGVHGANQYMVPVGTFQHITTQSIPVSSLCLFRVVSK